MKKENYVVHMVWKDKQAVVMLSTHAEALEPPGSKLFVWRKRRGGGKENMYRSDAPTVHKKHDRHGCSRPASWCLFLLDTEPQMVAPSIFLHVGYYYMQHVSCA
jgi:hypothetical protein